MSQRIICYDINQPMPYHIMSRHILCHNHQHDKIDSYDTCACVLTTIHT